MKYSRKRIRRFWPIYVMILPVIMFYVIFCYLPMFGIVVGFKDYNVLIGVMKSPWVGLSNFIQFLNDPYFWQVIKNTLIISLLKLVFCFPVPIILALLMNEMINSGAKKVIQTIIYLPHFISWVIIGGLIIMFLSPTTGIINSLIDVFGGKPIYFMTDYQYFRPIVIISDIWKNAGWGIIIYIAAIAGVNAELYEAAYIDGAGRWKQAWHVTLPGIRSIIVMLFILAVANILSAGFDQIFVLRNAYNSNVSDILDIYIYGVGIQSGNYSYATAVGLFKSVIATVLLLGTDRIVKATGERGII